MAQFINIDGSLINLDKVISVSIDGGRINFNVSGDVLEDFASFPEDHAQARRAYEWLTSSCVATFTKPEGDVTQPRYHAEFGSYEIGVDQWFIYDSLLGKEGDEIFTSEADARAAADRLNKHEGYALAYSKPVGTDEI